MLLQPVAPETINPTILATGINYDKPLENTPQTPISSYDSDKKIYSFPIQPLQQEKALADIKTKLEKLKKLNANWDEEGAQKPNPVAVDRAISLVNLMYIAAQETTEWKEPSTLTVDTDGRVFLIWWHGSGSNMRKISVYVSNDNISCIRTWGQSRDAKVDRMAADLNMDILKKVWRWLVNK